MTNPGNLIDGIVTGLRAVADLVTEHGGDAQKISAFLGFYPDGACLARAVYEMHVPGTLVVYQGYGPGGAGNTWHHRVSLIHRPRRSTDNDTASTYLKSLWLFTNGTPAGQSQRLIDYEFHADYESMLPPVLSRQTMIFDEKGAAIDYFELQMQIPEKGDY